MGEDERKEEEQEEGVCKGVGDRGGDREGMTSQNPKAQHVVRRKDQQNLMLSRSQTRGLRLVQ